MFTPLKNPDGAALENLFAASPSKTLRRIRHGEDHWYWPAEQATHAEGAKTLSVPYDLPPGAGDIIVP